MTESEQFFLAKAIEYMLYRGKPAIATEGITDLFTTNFASGKKFFLNMYPELAGDSDQEIFANMEKAIAIDKEEFKKKLEKENLETEKEYKALMKKVKLEKFMDFVFGDSSLNIL